MTLEWTYVLYAVLLTLLWDHAAIHNRWYYRPRRVLVKIEWTCEHLWSFMGALVAQLSSLILRLHLNDLLCTLWGLVSPIIGIALSPLEFFHGYLNHILAYFPTDQVSICIGSCIVIALVSHAAQLTLAHYQGLITNPLVSYALIHGCVIVYVIQFIASAGVLVCNIHSIPASPVVL